MMHTFMVACTVWVVFYVIAGIMTAIYFYKPGRGFTGLFFVGLGWWVVWFCVIGGSISVGTRNEQAM
jgi:hypothetical protein